jgi:hypothetical protein
MSWSVVIEPVDRGVVVSLTDGTVKSVIGRVAWSRRRSAHPLRSFKWSLRHVVARADAEVERLDGGAVT